MSRTIQLRCNSPEPDPVRWQNKWKSVGRDLLISFKLHLRECMRWQMSADILFRHLLPQPVFRHIYRQFRWSISAVASLCRHRLRTPTLPRTSCVCRNLSILWCTFSSCLRRGHPRMSISVSALGRIWIDRYRSIECWTVDICVRPLLANTWRHNQNAGILTNRTIWPVALGSLSARPQWWLLMCLRIPKWFDWNRVHTRVVAQGNLVPAPLSMSPFALSPANLQCCRRRSSSCLKHGSLPIPPATRIHNYPVRGQQLGREVSEHVRGLDPQCPIRSTLSYSVDRATAFCSFAMCRVLQSIALLSADKLPNRTRRCHRQTVSQLHCVRSHCWRFAPRGRGTWATLRCRECDWWCHRADSVFRTGFGRANVSIGRHLLSSKRFCVIWCRRGMLATQVARDRRSVAVLERVALTNPNWICPEPIAWSTAISNYRLGN